MTYGAASDVRLGDLLHGDGGLNSRLASRLLDAVGKGKAVYDRCKHTHMVGSCAVHLAAGASSPEVSASHDNGHFYTLVGAFFNAFADFKNGGKIKTALLSSGEHLAAYFK